MSVEQSNSGNSHFEIENQMSRKIIKIVIGGPVDAGKTQLIATLSDSKPLQTEVDLSEEDDSSEKRTTTVAMDFGSMAINSEKTVHLYGMPGQLRFEFMLETVAKGVQGVIFIVDAASLVDTVFPKIVLENYRTYYKVPVLVCVNKQDLPNALSPEAVRAALDLSEDTPIVPLCALEKTSATSALKTLLQVIGKKDEKFC